MKESLSKHLKGKDIFSWSSSYNFCAEEIGIVPKYWSYIDPHSATGEHSNVLQKMGDNKKHTRTLVFSDIVTKTIYNQEQYIGGSELIDKSIPLEKNRSYANYIKKLYDFSKEANIEFIPSTTYKDLYINTSIVRLNMPFEGGWFSEWPAYVEEHRNKTLKWLNEIDYGQDKFEERLTQEKLILGTNIRFPKNFLQRWGLDHWPTIPMEHYESKLTMCVLPLCHYLGKKNVFVVGFDGKQTDGGRAEISLQLVNMSYEHHLPKAMSSFKKLGMNVYSIVPSELTNLNQYMEYVPIESL
tara:strand:- start:49 stop:942 length:894 start_codon:yes stop_codon:yes gene_type:complete